MKKPNPFRFAGTRLAILCALSIAMITTTVFARNPNPEVSAPLTIILVRHAEKAVVPPENKDPDLSTAGLARAEVLKKMFGDAGVAAVYASQYKRTQQTAKPLADKLGLPVTQVDARNTAELVKQIRAQSPGQVIFITGHNNTVPEVIAALGGPKLPIIPETDYDNLFILTVLSDGSTKLLKLKY
ncbi:MAG TPA: phosphoglycerate mutase family protein [Pyrinomonadaceae bacterium]|nr:phosphoglycerate mutase family protein [Pyrinomonadaceae bacterium]